MGRGAADHGLDAAQTARIWDANKGDGKAELRGHEHVVEVAVFAPIAAYSAIRELAGITVRLARLSDPLSKARRLIFRRVSIDTDESISRGQVGRTIRRDRIAGQVDPDMGHGERAMPQDPGRP